MKRWWRVIRRGPAGVLVAAALAAVGMSAAGEPAGASAPHTGAFFRPVLCVVPPYDQFVRTPQPALSAASCGPSSLTPASMQVAPSRRSAQGFTFNSPQPAIILEGERTTKPTHDAASKVVLLSGLPGSSVFAVTVASRGMRYLLGPAVMSSRAIASATAVKTPAGQWTVDWTTTRAGTALWERVARASFHQLLAVDVGGVVVTAPIIEPTQASFTSFRGRGQVSGNWGQDEATRIAAAMQAGG